MNPYGFATLMKEIKFFVRKRKFIEIFVVGQG
jgi:hypothetical protein